MRPIARRLLSSLPSLSRLVSAAVVLVVCVVPVSAQNVHKDERLGFKVKVPRGWEEIPLRSDERWIVGRYRSPKAENTVDPTTGYSLKHNPELQIVALLRRKATPKKPDAEPKAEGESTTKPDAKKPEEKFYRNYPEYMKETYGRGHYIEKEESGTHAGLPVTKIEIKAERDVYQAEMRVFAWVFETELADVAVQVEVMADAQKELRSTIDGVLKSFAVIPITQALESGPTEASFLSTLELAKLTPADRKEKKLEYQRLEWERMTKDLPPGWTATEIDGVCVVNHVDAAFAKKVVEQITAIYAWLEVTFPEVGKFEHARLPIVRICADVEEESAFRGGSGWYWWDGGTQLVTHKDSKDWWDFEWDYIGSRTLGIWFNERDPEIWGALPRWLAIGLDEVIGGARMKSGKLVFDKGDREKWWLEDLPNLAEDAISVRTLLTLSRDDFDDSLKRDDWKLWWQAVSLTRYLVEARSKKTRQILTDYMGSLHQVLSELEAQDGKDKDKEKAPPKNEAEEEALYKKRLEWLKSRERALLDQSMARAFPGWTPADWKSLDREFRRSL
jgi:hypothetical protein